MKPTPSEATYLACDLGGTHTKVGAVRHGTVVARASIMSHASAGLRPHLPRIAHSLRDVASSAGVEPSECAGVSFAVPGLVDRDGRRVSRIHQKFEDAVTIDVNRWSTLEFGIGSVLDNDARAALIGEWRHGAGRGANNLLMITLGTGIGVAVVVDGVVLRGAHGAAGVLGGHLRLDLQGRRCMCGMNGCAEAEASTWALRELAGELPGVAGAADLDYEALARLVGTGPEYDRLWNRSLEIWSAMILDLAHAYDPERIIIGGGIARNHDVVERLATALDGDPWSTGSAVRVVATELGDDAALCAAPWLVDHAVHLRQETTAP